MKNVVPGGIGNPVAVEARDTLLSKEREFDLAWRWRHQEDVRALHELISAHHRLVLGIVKRFKGYGFPTQDLIQEGKVGLLEAANRFEPERGFRFSTFAMWWVRALVLDYVLRNWSVVRMATSGVRKTLFFKFQRLRNRVHGNVGGPLSMHERAALAATLGASVRQVEEMEAYLSLRDRSLNTPVGKDGEDDAILQDFVQAPDPSPEQMTAARKMKSVRHDWLRDALDILSDRERTIIEKRWMMEESSTLKRLGTEFGVSAERVRQIENAALSKLRQVAKSRSLEPVLS